MIESINKGNGYIDELDRYADIEARKDLNEEQARDLVNSLNHPLITNLEKHYKKGGKISLDNLNNLDEQIANIKKKIERLKEDVELEEINIKGELYNWDKIQEIFNKDVKKEFPNISFKKLKEWMQKPKKMLQIEKDKVIVFDWRVIKKLNIAILQNIFDEMDFWSLACGKEGSGKSCLHSQYIRYTYELLFDIGAISYKYDVESFTKGSVKELLNELEDPDKQDNLFEIFLLDEAEDLLRSNHSNADNKRFIRYMRRGRKRRAFIFLNTPQMGELNISVTLARVNFVFDVKMKQDPTTGLMKRGDYDFYILPRGEEIYSFRYRINILASKIRETFLKIFEKKTSYYAGLPKELMICQGKFNNVWGFDHKVYKKHMKKENLERELESDIKITEKQAKLIYKCSPKLRFWNFDKDEITDNKTKQGMKDYEVIKKFLQKLGKKFKLEGIVRE